MDEPTNTHHGDLTSPPVPYDETGAVNPEERADDVVHNLDKRVSHLEWDGRLELRNASLGMRLVFADGP